MTTQQQKPKNITCRCEAEFIWTKADAYDREPWLCPDCIEKESDQHREEAKQKVSEALSRITPARFFATDEAHPDFNRKLFELIKTWQPTPARPWLGLMGPTGKSKTRCIYRILPRLLTSRILEIKRKNEASHFTSPSFVVVRGCDLNSLVTDQFSNDDETRRRAVDKLWTMETASVLFCDDIGKQRNTPAVASALYAILDARHSDNLTTLWTANTSPEKFVMGMGEDMEAPLAGRIRECSTIFNVG